eukprot:10613236-Ditylum_brightwellii.AAC.1
MADQEAWKGEDPSRRFPYMGRSMLAWGNWNNANHKSRSNNEWNKCAKGVSDEEGKRRNELVN